MSITGGFVSRADAKEASVSATVIRADGTVEELGVISYWHVNPFKRFLGNIKIAVREKFKCHRKFKTPV